MVNKIKVFVIFLFFSFSCIAFAQSKNDDELNDNSLNIINSQNNSQSTGSVSYVKQDEKGNQTILQRLVWEDDEGASSFDFILEKQNKRGKYEQIIKKNLQDSFIELNLTYGEYRYKILVYNLFKKLEYETDWISFELVQAVEPRITSVTPKQIFLDEYNDGVYTISGRNFLEKSTIELFLGNKKINGEILKKDKSEIKFKVPINRLNPGLYSFKITNQGGFFAQEDGLSVKFKKLMDFDIFAGYSFSIIPYDNVIPSFFNNKIFPLGASAGFSFIPFKKGIGYFGFGLLFNYNRLNVQNEGYNIQGNLMTSHFTFVYQKPIIREKLVFDFHIGTGIGIINNMYFNFDGGYVSDELKSFAYSFDSGLGFQIYLKKRLYTEIRTNVSYSLFKDTNILNINPCIYLGYQF